MTDRPLAAVLGMGPLGMAMALALRQTGRFAAVAGWDPDFDVSRRAQRLNAADRFHGRPTEAVQRAAAVFVAVSAGQLRDVLTSIGPHLAAGAVVCSLDENHEHAAAIAAQALPQSVSFLSALPVLWETLDPEAPPSRGVFRRGVLALTPAASAHPTAVEYVADLAGALQMEPYFAGAREVDALSSAISRVPAVLSAALLRVVTREPSWRELSRLAGADFRQATAPAGADPARSQEALAADREHVARWLGALVDELAALRDALNDGQEPADFFAQAAEARARWLRDRQTPSGEAELPRLPEPTKRRFPF